jgi:hypothetical protein
MLQVAFSHHVIYGPSSLLPGNGVAWQSRPSQFPGPDSV